MRKLTIVAAVLVVVIALVALALSNLDTLIADNKDRIVAQVADALGREVDVAEIGVSLWPGIGVRLSGFRVADDPAFSTEDFVRAEAARLDVALWPLLSRDIRVTRFVLQKPEIRIIRDADGRFNFESLAPTPVAEATEETGVPTSEEQPRAGLPLLVALLDIEDGAVSFQDRADGAELRVGRIELRARDVSLDTPVNVKLEAALLSDRRNVFVDLRAGPLGAEGETPAPVPLDGSLELRALDPAGLLRALPGLARSVSPALTPLLDEVGPLSLAVGVSGRMDLLRFSDVDLRAPVFGAETPNLRLAGNLGPVTVGDADPPEDTAIDVQLSLGPVAGERVLGHAALRELLPRDLAVEGPMFAAVTVAGTLDEVALTGTVDAAASTLRFGDLVSKAADHPLHLSVRAGWTPAALDVREFRIEADPLRVAADGRFGFDAGPAMDLHLRSVQIGESSLEAAVRIKRFAPFRAEYAITAPLLRLADLQDDAGATTLQAAHANGRVWQQDAGLRHTGRLNVERGAVAEMEFGDFALTSSIADRVARLTDVKLRAFGGTLTGRGQYAFDTESPRFSAQTQVTDLQLSEFFRSVLPSTPQHIDGTATANLRVEGSGAGWEAIRPDLRGEGRLDVADGAVRDVNVAEGVLSGLTGIPGLSLRIPQRLRDRYPAVFTAQDTAFDEFTARFRIFDGKLNVERLRIAARDFLTRGAGTIDFDQKVDLDASLTLSEDLSAELIRTVKELRYIAAGDGRIEIPFALAGVAPNLHPAPDAEHLVRLLQRAATRVLGEKVLDRVLKPKKPRESGQDADRNPDLGDQLLRRGLDALFGR